jgi:non-canonical (house-cleaning) NTP pyrophosphatase
MPLKGVGALLVGVAFAVGVGEPRALAQQHSAGDVAEARELFNQGLALRDKGDLNGAIDKLRAAHALANTPITGVELGRTYVSAGKLVEARETLLSVGRLPVGIQETPRSATARSEAAQLADQVRTRIPSLVVKVGGAPADSIAVTIDGVAVPREALMGSRLVNPGSHALVATGANGAGATTTVDVKEGETRTVELDLVPTGAPAAPAVAEGIPAAAGVASEPDAPSQHSSALPAVMYTGFGLAVAGVAVGAVTGVMAMSKASSVKSACEGLMCPRSVDGDLTSGRTLGTVSTIAFAAAGVGAAAGVIALVLRPHHEGAAAAATSWLIPWFAPGSAGLSGGSRF